MDMHAMREWLIARGIPAEELDDLVEPPVIRDIGEALTQALVNNDALGEAFVMMIIKSDEQDARITDLESRLLLLEGGAA